MQEQYRKRLDILNIIRENFSNGLRNDFIDTGKVMRIYAANYPEKIISRETVAEIILSRGIKVGERFYFPSAENIVDIFFLFNSILKRYSIAFYSTVYEKHLNFFLQMKIFSYDVLRKILQRSGNKNFYSDEFCSSNIMTNLKNEILQLFIRSEHSWSLEDLKKIFVYVPEEKILSELHTGKYLPTVDGKYLFVSQVKFDVQEIWRVEEKIFTAVNEKKFASPEDYDFPSNLALNPEISEKVLIDLIQKNFLAFRYKLRGKNFFLKGSGDVNFGKNAMKKFLEDKDEISLVELAKRFKDFCDSPSYNISKVLNCGLEFMVRVDENLFVKDSFINFDVAGIDDALTPFVQNKIISLRAVTSFTGFPPVEGYAWNLFLLESFLRKYSKKFSYNAPCVNNAGVGAIYLKSVKFKNYLDVQVSVLLQEKIPLEKAVVENFLVERGFRIKRIDNITQKIISKAQEFSHF